MDIVERTHPLLKDLARESGETVDLSRFNRDHAIFVNQVPGSHRLQAVSAIGETFPLHCTANGKAMLALLEAEMVQQMVMRPLPVFTPKTIASGPDLLQALAEVRRNGIAVDMEEHTLGICALGMAFQTPARQIFAISMPIPTVRFASVRRHCEKLLRAALVDLPHLVP
jgi:DNA-binding IclR family transcriptional regulator